MAFGRISDNLILLVSPGGMISCGGGEGSPASGASAGICGKYINEEEPWMYFILFEDGTFVSNPMGGLNIGYWHVYDHTLFLTFSQAEYDDYNTECEIQGNKIIDPRYGDWIKERR